MLEETRVTCPHCWEEITLTLDLSVPAQDYVEDCPVCCHPLRILVSAEDGELTGIEIRRMDG